MRIRSEQAVSLPATQTATFAAWPSEPYPHPGFRSIPSLVFSLPPSAAITTQSPQSAICHCSYHEKRGPQGKETGAAENPCLSHRVCVCVFSHPVGASRMLASGDRINADASCGPNLRTLVLAASLSAHLWHKGAVQPGPGPISSPSEANGNKNKNKERSGTGPMRPKKGCPSLHRECCPQLQTPAANSCGNIS